MLAQLEVRRGVDIVRSNGIRPPWAAGATERYRERGVTVRQIGTAVASQRRSMPKPLRGHHTRHKPWQAGAMASVVLVCAAPAMADDAASPDDTAPMVFATVAVGGSTFGPAYHLSLNCDLGPVLVSAQTAASEELTLFGPSPKERWREGGVLVGHTWRWQSAGLSAAAGLSSVHVVTRGAFLRYENNSALGLGTAFYEAKEGQVLGVPVVVHVFYHGSAVGIGALAFLNVNGYHSYGGAAVALSVGAM